MLLAACGIQTFINLLYQSVRSIFAQHHDGKLYDIVNEKVNISMSNLLVLLLFEFAHRVLHYIALGANKLTNFVNCFFI